PTSQQPTCRWVNIGEWWPVGKAELLDRFQTLEQAEQDDRRLTVRCHLEPIQSRARRIGRLAIGNLRRPVRADRRLRRGEQLVELATLRLSQVSCERVECLLQRGLSGSGDQIAQRGAAPAYDVMLEQPGVC